MGFLFVFCVALPVSALAVQRNEFKRLVVLAVVLLIVKYLFVWVFIRLDTVSEELNPLLLIGFFLAMLPEIGFRSESGNTIWLWAIRLFAGLLWNFLPAYLILLFLPEQEPANTD